jgi:hypothetical protein
MATPSWTDKVSIVSVTKVANGATASGTLDLAGLFGAYIFMRVGRLTSTAPATGIYIYIRRLLYNSGASADVPHPGALGIYQDSTVAANLTTLNGTPSFPTAAVTLTSATGFGGNQYVCITDNATTPTRVEFHHTSKVASTTLTMDRNLANTSIVSGDTITNNALVCAPLWIDGTPSSGNIEVVFDYGLEVNSSAVVVEAFAQTLNSIS